MEQDNSTMVLVAINDKLVVHGQRIFLELRMVSGCGKGKKSASKITPSTACYVIKKEGSYHLLNANDPRVSNIIPSYDGATQVEFILIEDDRRDEVGFIAGDLLPQQTPNISFERFIKGVATSPKKQNFILEYFCSDKSKERSTLRFNLTSFLKLLGKNAPSRATVNRFLSNKKVVAKPSVSNPTQVNNQPNASINSINSDSFNTISHNYETLTHQIQTYVSQSHETQDDGKQFLDTLNALSDLDVLDNQNTQNQEFQTHHQKPDGETPKISQDSNDGDPNFDISDDLKNVWINHSKSEFSIQQVIERLRGEPERFQEALIKKLNFNPTSAKFKKFVIKINEFMTGA